MGTKRHPRRGSLGIRPRRRARRIYSRVKVRPPSKEVKIQEFAGYKVGMTHVLLISSRKKAITAKQEVSRGVTLLECPPINVCGIRVYTQDENGLHAAGEMWNEKLDKHLVRLRIKNRRRKTMNDLKKIEGIKQVRLIVHTNPSKTSIGKKRPELFEIDIAGNGVDEKLKFASEKLGKELKVSEIFKTGDFVDVIGVTKGKGFQGSVKREGVKRLSHKSQKVRRKAGTLGPWHPAKTRWTVPQMGDMGYHNRTEMNKRILMISNDPKEADAEGGWLRYGIVKNDFIVVKGSVQGAPKRLVRFRAPIRPKTKEYGEPRVVYLSLESKQGA